jgi:hypothetical protein
MNPKFGEYYIVEISFRSGNPKHRSIGVFTSGNMWDIFNMGYEGIKKISPEYLVKKGGSFELIKRIEIK